MRHTVTTLFGILLVGAAPAHALDEIVNRRISYQGQLQTAGAPAGPVTVTFKLYPTSGPAWGPEAHQVTPDASGNFVAVIGATGLDRCERLDDGTLKCNGTSDGKPDLDQIDVRGLQLEVTVNGTTLAPRQTILPAFHASTADKVLKDGVTSESIGDGSVMGNHIAPDLRAQGVVPAGAVMFFNLPSCPSGWIELTAARGRYLVGLTPSGALNGQVGTPLGNLENRPVGQHSHGVNDPQHEHGIRLTGSSGSGPGDSFLGNNNQPSFTGRSTRASTGISVQNTGAVPGTNAPYLQLLVCQSLGLNVQ